MLSGLLTAGFIGLLAMAEFVERPFTDFDTVVHALAPHGQWTPHPDKKFVFRPHQAAQPDWAPLRLGQWIYTDYGWTWHGTGPTEWATGHYGYWFKDAQGWCWVPDIHWLPGCVEWLQSGDYIGWRPTPLDRFSNPNEPEAVRYADPTQWNFIPREKLRGPLTPADFASPEQAAALLVKAEPADHIFISYREIPRPGPPPDILANAEGKLPPIPVVREQLEPSLMPEIQAPNSFYTYRPRFHQDGDGIFRRIDLFLNPRKENPEYQRVIDTLAPKRELTPKEERALRGAAEMERHRRQHEQDIYR
jgi:hypothetical protein